MDAGEEDRKAADVRMDEDSDDHAPKREPRKRMPKKVIPVGKNGLKKKRVVKSKTDFDEKGYMGEHCTFYIIPISTSIDILSLVTVDYSSYESVDEEEEEPKTKKNEATKPSAAKPGAKPSTSKGTDSKSANGSGSLKKMASNKGLDRSSSVNKNKSVGGGQKTLGSFFGGKAKG